MCMENCVALTLRVSCILVYISINKLIGHSILFSSFFVQFYHQRAKNAAIRLCVVGVFFPLIPFQR